jgi:hypothetical protein
MICPIGISLDLLHQMKTTCGHIVTRIPWLGTRRLCCAFTRTFPEGRALSPRHAYGNEMRKLYFTWTHMQLTAARSVAIRYRFIAAWLVSYVVYRVNRYDKIEASSI